MTVAQSSTAEDDRLLEGGLALVRPRFDDIAGVTARLQGVLESGQLTNGRYVAELEDRLRERFGVPHVIAVGSCTAGLMLVYQGLGVRGDVVMPSHTFSASAHAVAWTGNKPRFADIERTRATLDPDSVQEVLDGAAAISATHLYGHPAEAERLEELAAAAGVPLVFDSAHALGSRRGPRPVGGLGTAEVFSMSPTKVTVAGEGGIVATHDSDLAQHVRVGRNYGNPGDYNCGFPGLNARMSELHAVLALSSLDGLDTRMSQRAAMVDAFDDALEDGEVRVVRPAPGDVSTYKDLTLHLPAGTSAAQLQDGLSNTSIDSRRYFWPPVHRQDAYAGAGGAHSSALPITDEVAAQLLTVPMPTSAAVAGALARTVCRLLAAQVGERR